MSIYLSAAHPQSRGLNAPKWGILGGMGPLASADLIRRVYLLASDGRREQDMPRIILNSDCTMPDRTSAIMNDRLDELLASLTQVGKSLEKAGADIIVMCCITAHCVLPSLRQNLSTPVLSLIDLLSTALELSYEPHLVIATKGSFRAELFSSLPGEIVLPNLWEQDALHEAIYHLKTTGDTTLLAEKVADLLVRTRCRAVLAGCTEVSLVADKLPTETRLLDPIDLLCKIICKDTHLLAEIVA